MYHIVPQYEYSIEREFFLIGICFVLEPKLKLEKKEKKIKTSSNIDGGEMREKNRENCCNFLRESEFLVAVVVGFFLLAMNWCVYMCIFHRTRFAILFYIELYCVYNNFLNTEPRRPRRLLLITTNRRRRQRRRASHTESVGARFKFLGVNFAQVCRDFGGSCVVGGSGAVGHR